jgi:hypothetical protein
VSEVDGRLGLSSIPLLYCWMRKLEAKQPQLTWIGGSLVLCSPDGCNTSSPTAENIVLAASDTHISFFLVPRRMCAVVLRTIDWMFNQGQYRGENVAKLSAGWFTTCA